jgi:magnesium transporter
MADIYRKFLSSMSETYSTIVSNNLNNIMKFLAGMTIVISVPTIISSFLGMNVPFGSLGENPMSALGLLIISIILTVITAVILRKKNLL